MLAYIPYTRALSLSSTRSLTVPCSPPPVQSLAEAQRPLSRAAYPALRVGDKRDPPTLERRTTGEGSRQLIIQVPNEPVVVMETPVQPQ